MIKTMKKLLVCCLLFAAVPVLAQDYYGLEDYGLSKNTTRVEFYGGAVLPQDNWEPNGKDLGGTGWTAGIGFIRNLTPVFALGMDGNYAQLGDGEKDASHAYYRTGIATGLVTGRVNFFPKQATRVYIPFGLGIGHVFARQKFSDGSHRTVDGTDLAGMLGAGLEFDLDDSLVFGVEGRYYLLNAADEVKDTFGKNRYHHFLVMLKMGCRF
jgi:opacity protein-like surface antigen